MVCKYAFLVLARVMFVAENAQAAWPSPLCEILPGAPYSSDNIPSETGPLGGSAQSKVLTSLNPMGLGSHGFQTP